MKISDLLVQQIPGKGRGVVANRAFSAGEVIEECPILIVEDSDYVHIEKTILENYMYDWDDRGAVILGYGWLYNHSFTPNAEYVRDFDRQLMVYKAIKDISLGDEICVNYNGVPDRHDPLDWFTVV